MISCSMCPGPTFLALLRPSAQRGAAPSWLRLGLVVTALGRGIAYAQTPPADPLIARVNGVEIHQSDLALAEEDLGQSIPAVDEQGKRDYLVGYLTDVILVAKAAEAKKIPDTAAFQAAPGIHPPEGTDGNVARRRNRRRRPDRRSAAQDLRRRHKADVDEPEVHARHILFRVNNPSRPGRQQGGRRQGEGRHRASQEG